MSDLSLFEYENQPVRSISIDGEPWFCLSDCLKAIGTKSRTNDAKALIEEGLGDGYDTIVPIVDALGRQQDTLFIAEPALTFLLGRSRTEAGKKFNRWVHGEVLPSIRKTRKFEIQRENLERQFQPEVPLRSIEELAAILGKRFGAAYEQRVLQQNIKKFHPYFDLPILEPEEKASVSSGERLLTPTQIASKIGFAYNNNNFIFFNL